MARRFKSVEYAIEFTGEAMSENFGKTYTLTVTRQSDGLIVSARGVHGIAVEGTKAEVLRIVAENPRPLKERIKRFHPRTYDVYLDPDVKPRDSRRLTVYCNSLGVVTSWRGVHGRLSGFCEPYNEVPRIVQANPNPTEQVAAGDTEAIKLAIWEVSEASKEIMAWGSDSADVDTLQEAVQNLVRLSGVTECPLPPIDDED